MPIDVCGILSVFQLCPSPAAGLCLLLIDLFLNLLWLLNEFIAFRITSSVRPSMGEPGDGGACRLSVVVYLWHLLKCCHLMSYYLCIYL